MIRRRCLRKNSGSDADGGDFSVLILRKGTHAVLRGHALRLAERSDQLVRERGARVAVLRREHVAIADDDRFPHAAATPDDAFALQMILDVPLELLFAEVRLLLGV